MELVSRAHGTDHRRTGPPGLHDQLQFSGHGVDGVDDVAILREIKLFRRLRAIENL